MNFDKICRICRKLCIKKRFKLISSNIDDVPITEIISNILKIDSTHHTTLFPQKICDKCFEILQNVIELQKVALESENYFSSHLIPELTIKDEVEIKEEHIYEEEDEFEENIDEELEEEVKELVEINVEVNIEKCDEKKEPKSVFNPKVVNTGKSINLL